MDRRLSALMAATILVLLLAAAFVNVPGYTDAEYYYAVGQQLGQGEGFSQPFIWNYLAEPDGLPQPSNLYWMPLTSMLAAIPLTVLGDGFRNAQLIFILLAAALPFLSWQNSRQLSATKSQQRFTWLLAIFPGYFLPFFVTTDAFAPFALLGAGALLLMAKLPTRATALTGFFAGLLIGLAHLTRADGFLLLAPAALALWLSGKERWRSTAALALGYLLVISPWLVRLTVVTGSPFPPGAANTIWLRNYDELFSYPTNFLKAGYLFELGVGTILLDRARALGSNLVSLLAVNHLVFLAPFALVGGWKLRRERLVQFAGAYLLLLLIVMSFIFPFPGSRGGFFHSSAALMPIIWALAPIGLHVVVERAASFRGWQPQEAANAFSWGMILIAAGVTGFLAWQRLIGPAVNDQAGWDTSHRAYQQVGQRLEQLDEDPGLVAINNPPGYWVATQQRSVVIPDGEIKALLTVVADFGVEWVVLEANHPAGLSGLYQKPEPVGSLDYVQTIEPANSPPIHLFRKVKSE